MAGNRTLWAVDDEPDMLDALGHVFRDAGFLYQGFGDPLEFLKNLEQAVTAPSLVVVDLNLPNMSGAELVKELRAHPLTRRVPIVVVTALSSESSVLNAFKAGADDVVRKPFGVSELLARISWQLSRSNEEATLRRENNDLLTMTQLAKAMSESRSLPYMLREMIDVTKNALMAARVSVYLVDQRSGDLHRAMPSDPSRAEGSPNMTLDMRDLPWVAEAVAMRRHVLLGADQTDALLKQMGGIPPTKSPLHSSAVFPMLAQGEFVGILVCISPTPKFGANTRESSIGAVVADLAAMAVGVSRKSDVAQPAPTPAVERGSSVRFEGFDPLLGSIVESSPDAIVAANERGKILVFNQAAESVLGWSRDEAIGNNVRMLYTAGGAERVMHMLRSNNFGGRGRLEPRRTVLLDRNGEEIPVEMSAAIVTDEDGHDIATFGVFTDMRPQLQMEERLQEATENLERSRRQAVVAELAGAAAHELNQPLTSLLGYAELLRKRLDDEHEYRRPVDKIYNEAKRIADVVRKIGRITDYRTKEYVGGTRIVDLDQSSEPFDDFQTGERTMIADPDDETMTHEMNRTRIPGITDGED